MNIAQAIAEGLTEYLQELGYEVSPSLLSPGYANYAIEIVAGSDALLTILLNDSRLLVILNQSFQQFGCTGGPSSIYLDYNDPGMLDQIVRLAAQERCVHTSA